MEARKQKVLDVINKMIELSEPIYYDDINRFYRAKDSDNIISAEKEMPELGIACPTTRGSDGKWTSDNDTIGISTLSLIATITDCLCDDRLAFIIEKGGLITGVGWSGFTGPPTTR
jgi:hypothetical protein